MRKSSFFGPLLFLSLCVGAVWLYFTPYLALKELQAAAEAGDREALERMVDFPAVRASVKDEVRGVVADGVGRDRGPLASLGAALAGAVADPLVDAFVTPDGIAAAVRGERPSLRRGRAGAERRDKEMEVERGYQGADTFLVTFREKESGREGLTLVLRRQGLSEWRLSGIRLAEGGAAR
jgi:hypothetical protein